MWAEQVVVADAEVVRSYADGGTAVTRRAAAAGSASYVGCLLDPTSLRDVVADLAEAAGVVAALDPALDGAVTRRVRGSAERRFTFLINHTAETQQAGEVELAPYDVVVLR